MTHIIVLPVEKARLDSEEKRGLPLPPYTEMPRALLLKPRLVGKSTTACVQRSNALFASVTVPCSLGLRPIDLQRVVVATSLIQYATMGTGDAMQVSLFWPGRTHQPRLVPG